MSSVWNQIRNGVVFSFTSLICFGVAYATISWPSSAPSGEVDGGKYSAKLVPATAVMAFNATTCPTGWIAANGTNGTPDLRGTFVRGIGGDANGRDVVRALLSYQADDFKRHSHGMSGGFNGNPLGGYNSTWPIAGAYGA